MKIGPGLILLLGGSYLALNAKNAGEKLLNGLSFDPVSFDLKTSGINLLNTRFSVTLKVFNRSGVSVPVYSVSGGIFQIVAKQQVLLGNFNISNRFDVPANGSINVPLEITASNLSTLQSIWSIFVSGSTPIIQVQGKAYGPLGVFVPIDVYFDKIQLFKVK